MSPSSQSHQTSYFPQTASDVMLQPPPPIASAYRRTLETYVDGGTGSIDLDTFDIPCPPSALVPSPRSSRFAASDGLAMTAAATEKDNASSGARRRKKSGSGDGNQTLPSSSSAALSSSSAVGDVPDLGEVDLNDGKNEERPQRFKAVIHFKRRDTGSSGRLQQGGGAGRLPPSDGESYGSSS